MISAIVRGALALERDRSRIGLGRLLQMLVGIGLTLPGTVSAQFTLDNQTILISGVISNWTGDYCVGRTNSSDLLRIEGGGKLTVSNGMGYIGYAEYAANNKMQVTGSGSLWTNDGSLCIGYAGSASQLSISNSGMVYCAAGILGNFETSSNNSVVVTGPGTTWFAGSTSVGGGGSGNQLTIANGARVISDVSYLGLYSWSSNNSVVVTDSGSVWSNSSYVCVGNGGPGNELSILHGGVVCDTIGYVPQDNRVLVSGEGSLWRNSSDLRVLGSGAQLDITSTGRVLSINGYVGYAQSGNGNGVLVAGPGSAWNNDQDLWVGYQGGNYQLAITNGAMVDNNDGHVGDYDSSSNNMVVVDGASSVWSNRGTLYVGQYGPGNQLTITGGGKVYDDVGELGYGASSCSNTVVVDGGGSVWSNRSGLYVGSFGGFSQLLMIRNGGAVYDTLCILGYDGAGSNNTVIVSDPGSVWRHAGQLAIGLGGVGNQLVITNGGVVSGASGGVNTSSNRIHVTGSGSTWSNDTFLIFGGTGNLLEAGAGGQVFSNEGRLGGNDNTVRVTDPGSLWTSCTNLYVGYLGAYNQLVLTAGGAAYALNGILGFEDGDSNNTVVVAGSGSMLNCRDLLYVGVDGSGNSLVVSNGGAVSVQSTGLVVGAGRTCEGNHAMVADGVVTVTNSVGNSTLEVHRGLFVMNGGAVNADRLLVTNGANGVFTFNSGVLKTKGVLVDNGQVFVVGNGVAPATFAVSGTTNVFANNLRIRTNAMLTGCAAIMGGVLVEGSLVADSSASVSASASLALGMAAAPSGLTIHGSITNNGTMVAVNGGVLEVLGTVVNNGIIDIIDGTTNFHSLFVNNGIVLNAAGDADGDGMPNGWERAYGLDVLSGVGTNGAAGNPDGDGMNNLEEYYAGTVPTNADSVLGITGIRVTPAGVRVDWKGGTVVSQYVECASALYPTGSLWRAIFTNPPPTAVTTNVVDTVSTNRILFYRIKTKR